MTRAGHQSFVGTDVWQLLLTRAKTHLGRPYLVWQPFDTEPSTLTFDELARQAAAVAAGRPAGGSDRATGC